MTVPTLERRTLRAADVVATLLLWLIPLTGFLLALIWVD